MKNLKYICVFSVFLICYGVSYSQESSRLIGDWIFDFDQSTIKMSESARAHFENMANNRKSKVLEFYEDRILSFSPDGVYKVTLSDDRQILGSWDINDTGILSIALNETKNLTYNYSFAGDEVLILKAQGSLGNPLFKELIFVKKQ